MTVSRKKNPSKIEIWVGRFMALTFFSILVYVCFYFSQIVYYRLFYPIEFVDLRETPATEPPNPEDDVWPFLNHLCNRIEMPGINDVREWTQNDMETLVEKHAQVLADFRHWRDTGSVDFGLEPYQGMGLQMRVLDTEPDFYWRLVFKQDKHRFFKLARLFTVQGVLEIRSNRRAMGLTWISDSFAICRYFLQNPNYFCLTNGSFVFRTNLNFLLEFLPAQTWYPLASQWFPTEQTWRASLAQGMWSNNIDKFRFVDDYFSLRHFMKPKVSDNLRFQYSQADTLRLFSKHYEGQRKASMAGPMIYPDFDPENDKLSRKINKSALRMIANLKRVEKLYFFDVPMAITTSHAIRARGTLLSSGTPISGTAISQQLRSEGFTNPFTNRPYEVSANGALIVPAEYTIQKPFTYESEGKVQSRYQTYFDHGLVAPEGSK